MNPVTHLWQSTVCAGIAALLAVAFRRASASTRHNIWLAASIKFLVPLGLLLDLGRYAAASIAFAPSSSSAATAARWITVAADPVAAGLTPAIERAAIIGLVAVWAAGVIALTIWRSRQWSAVARVIRGGRQSQEGRIADALRRAPRSSARPVSIALVECESTLEPGVTGARRPTLIWPVGLTDRLSDAELNTIVAHEAAHVDRRDHLTVLAHTIVETIFWFNPVVWWIGARLLSERERACDEAVMQASADTRSYAEAILKVCGFCLQSPTAFVAGVGGSNLRSRIEWILTAPAIAPLSRSARVLLAAICLTTIAAPIVAGAAGAQGKDATVHETKEPGVKPPSIAREVKPNYTDKAKAARIQGIVHLDAIVLKNGDVGTVRVTKSLDTKYGLDKEAVRAIKQWRFNPGTKDGTPVDVRVEIEMSFTLK
jgi:bla regulator protein blaR1